VTPEGRIKADVKQALTQLGWFVFNVAQFNKRGYSVHCGISDLIAVGYARVLFMEIKTDTGKQSSAQREFMAQVQAHGGEYYVIRSLDELLSIEGVG